VNDCEYKEGKINAAMAKSPDCFTHLGNVHAMTFSQQ
jgi:hypothetical protein